MASDAEGPVRPWRAHITLPPKGDRVIRAYHAKSNERALVACRQRAWIALAAITLVILLQVFYRYVLNSPLSWPEEAARYVMVWMTFPAAGTPSSFYSIGPHCCIPSIAAHDTRVIYLTESRQHAGIATEFAENG